MRWLLEILNQDLGFRLSISIEVLVINNNNSAMQAVFMKFLECASNLKSLGYKLIRIAILIIFVWIGGLKFANYEANGIVPFVANSPLMSFFLKDANNKVTTDEGKVVKEYTLNKVPEGQYNDAKHTWHVENRTYLFSHGLGILIMTIGILVFLGLFSPYLGLIGEVLCIIMTIGTLSFLVTTPEVWVHASPEALAAGEWANGFPFLTGAGRLVIKDTAILAGAVVLLSDSASKILARLRK
ncbi:hypothetical protein HMPREF9134_00522 [Porphyromonas catoniae F0037]|jgi:uncharacterized protein HI_0219|uniref:Inner membrane protein YkgB n=2 Tax=Porphyromonas catoniae TaxID=41976 RepID=L1NF50_9PORP|nr:hypothetical protein HMPREF9134_00522 [Porphyromonas catoniae F0037]